MHYVHSVSGHHRVPVTSEGLPLEPQSRIVLLAIGSALAVLALILSVVGVAH